MNRISCVCNNCWLIRTVKLTRGRCFSFIDKRVGRIMGVGIFESFSFSIIGTVHDCRSANAVGIRNVNTVLLNGKIVIFKASN